MSDLSEHDRAIVEAAEAYIDGAPIQRGAAAPSVLRIMDAVQAKRKAQQCNWWVDDKHSPCRNPAIESFPLSSRCTEYRCAEHKVRVTAL